MGPIGSSASDGNNPSTAAIAEEPQVKQEQIINEQMQSPNHIDHVGCFQQMGDRSNVGGMAGISGMGVTSNVQSAQTNNQYGTNTHGTERYISFKFVDDPRPYLGDPNLQVNYSEGHGKWRVETTMPVGNDLGDEYDI